MSTADFLAGKTNTYEYERERLARLAVDNGDGTLEINDPVHFNGESRDLLIDLLSSLWQLHNLFIHGRALSMVLQGSGSHFCTGG